MKPIATAESLPEGKILLTERTRQDLTNHQMEVIAVGAAGRCEDVDCERPHAYERATPLSGIDVWHVDEAVHFSGIEPHDWVLVAHRSLSETDQDNLFVCSQDDILAILYAD